MRMEGSMEVAARPQETIQKYTAPHWLGRCLPNLFSLKVTGEGEFRATFYIDLGEIAKVTGYLSRVRADMLFKYEDRGEDVVRVSGTGRVVGAKIGLTIDVKVKPSANGTLIDWAADADLGIIQRILGEETTRKVANRQVELLTTRLKEALNTSIN